MHPTSVRTAAANPFIPLLLALLLVALPVVSHAAAVAKPYGGETPEALVERLRTAAENDDFATLAACMAPDDRAAMALALIMMTGMVMAFAGMGMEMGMDEEKKEETAAELEAMEERFESIIDRYGVDRNALRDEPAAGEEMDAAEALAGVDQVGLVADLMVLIQSLPGEEVESPEDEMALPAGELQGLEVDGDRASGRVGDEEVEFVRVDGRWYLALGLEADAMGPGGMASPGTP